MQRSFPPRSGAQASTIVRVADSVPYRHVIAKKMEIHRKRSNKQFDQRFGEHTQSCRVSVDEEATDAFEVLRRIYGERRLLDRYHTDPVTVLDGAELLEGFRRFERSGRQPREFQEE